MQQKVHETPTDPSNPEYDRCDPYRILKYFYSICDPTQERLFCRYQTIQQGIHHRKPENHNILHICTNKNVVIGETALGKMVKELAFKCGFKNPNKCTNHGAKALGCTTMKYAPVKVPVAARLHHQGHSKDISGNPYYRQNDVAEKLVQDALINTSDQANKCNIRLSPPLLTPISKKHLLSFTAPPLLPSVPPNPNTITFLRTQLEELKTDKIALQCELTENLGLHVDTKKKKDEEIGRLKDKVNEMESHILTIETQIKNDTEKRLVIQKSLTTTKRKYDEVTLDLTKLRAIVDEASKLKKRRATPVDCRSMCLSCYCNKQQSTSK